MDIMKSIKLPFQDMKTLLIGIIIAIIPIIQLLNIGYAIKVVKNRKGLPGYTFDSALIMDTIKALVFFIIWGIIGAIIIAILGAIFGGTILAGINFNDPTTIGTAIAGALGTIALGVIVMLVVFIILGLLVAAGFINFARKGSLMAGFDFGTIFGIAFSGKFIIAAIVAIILSGIILTAWTWLVGMITFSITLPFLVLILIPIAQFPVMVMCYDILADSA